MHSQKCPTPPSQFNCKGGKPYCMSVRSESLLPKRGKKKKGKKKKDIGDGITPSELKDMKKEADKKLHDQMDSGSEEEESEDEEDARARKEEEGVRGVGCNIEVGFGVYFPPHLA